MSDARIPPGPGVGMFKDGGFYWRVQGRGVDQPWEWLVHEAMVGHCRYNTPEQPWDLSPDYQRPSVWTEQQQRAYIGHVLSGGQHPPIYVQRYEEDFRRPNEVIDGQQRLRAIDAFVHSQIPGDVLGHGEVWWRDMSAPERRRIGVCSSRVVYVDLPRVDRLRFYLRLNGGTPHTREELERVRGMLEEEVRCG